MITNATLRTLARSTRTDPEFAQMLFMNPSQALRLKRAELNAHEVQSLSILEGGFLIQLLSGLESADRSSWHADTVQWGVIANPNFDRQPIAAVFFFAGSGKGHGQKYFSSGCNAWPVPCLAPNNEFQYTRHPLAGYEVNWSDSLDNRHSIVDDIVSTGFNVIEMSYWGPPGTRNWAYYAPMQTSTCANDELVDLLVSRGDILLYPWIEDSSKVPDCDPDPSNGGAFIFADDIQTLKGLDKRVFDLVARYIVQYPKRAQAWAQIYDSQLVPRYAIGIGHARATDPSMSDAEFISRLQAVADAIHLNYPDVNIGFILDDLGGPATSHDNNYYMQARRTAAVIRQHPAILAIRPFRSEWQAATWGGTYTSTEESRVALFDRKRSLAISWLQEGVPFIQDFTTGYDGHLVFPKTAAYGDSDAWRNDQAAIRGLGQIGLAYTAWNGFTEGWIGTSAKEPDHDGSPGDTWNRWLRVMLTRDPRDCYFVPFQNGEPTSDVVYGAICEKWVQLAGPHGALGLPISTEVDGFSPGARWTAFEHGVIFWHSDLGAHEVHGQIAEKYYTYSNPPLDGGPLGLPTSDEQGGVTRISEFENGAIVWQPGDEPQIFMNTHTKP